MNYVPNARKCIFVLQTCNTPRTPTLRNEVSSVNTIPFFHNISQVMTDNVACNLSSNARPFYRPCQVPGVQDTQRRPNADRYFIPLKL